MLQTRPALYSIEATLTYAVGVEKWLNFTLYFGYIGVLEHIDKAERDAKEAECVAQNSFACINNQNMFAL
jgi:hypothetical protein